MAFRHKEAKLGSEEAEDGRNFPTKGYFATNDGPDYEKRHGALMEEAERMGRRWRVSRADAADKRVGQGPTAADEETIPHIREAWEWACSTTGRLGLKPGHLRYGVTLDALTRLKACELIARRDSVSDDEARELVGFDSTFIHIEHNAMSEDVDAYIGQGIRWMQSEDREAKAR